MKRIARLAYSNYPGKIEYFFALAPTPQGSPLFATFTRAETIAFLSPCPEVASSITYLHTGVVNPGSPDNGKELTIVKQVRQFTSQEYLLITKLTENRLLFGGLMRKARF